MTDFAKSLPEDPKSRDFQTEAHQQTLYQCLVDQQPELARLYRSALKSASDGTQDGEFFLAAHSLRLLMTELPTAFALESFGSLPQLTGEVAKLDTAWNAAQQSKCRTGDGWSGTIDDLLAKLLDHLKGFFAWREDSLLKKEKLTAEIFRRADPANAPLPQMLYRQTVERWIFLFRYFTQVAHGKRTTKEEFSSHLAEIEQLMLQGFDPRPSQSFLEIDRLLEEEDPNA